MVPSVATPPAPVEPPVERKAIPGPQPVPMIGRPVRPLPVRVHRRGRRWLWAMLAVLAVATLLAVEAWRSLHATTTVHYISTPVTRGAVTRTVTASGSVNPVITIQVGTYVSGVIQE
jgi:HlyD family secretion protein